MGLYSRLFKLYEESEVDPDIELDRRELLETAVTGTVSFSIARKLLKDPEPSQDSLEEIYGSNFRGYEEARPNLLLDVTEVEGNNLDQEIIDKVESIYDRNGINLIIAKRKQKYPQQEFQTRYGGEVARILGTDGYSGFFRENISSKMRQHGIQTVVTPGKPDNPRGWLEYENKYRTGFATDSIALGSNTAFEQGYPEDPEKGKQIILMHEIGHACGLEHVKEPSNIMYENVDLNADLTYSEKQWEKIKEVI